MEHSGRAAVKAADTPGNRGQYRDNAAESSHRHLLGACPWSAIGGHFGPNIANIANDKMIDARVR